MLNLFIPITKIDSAKRIVYGTLTQAVADKSGEIIDYQSTKEAYQKWSDEAFERSQGKSKGNLRAMHGNVAAGKFTDIVFDDENEKIEGAAYVSDDNEWKKCEDGTYTGFSHGGSYAKRWKDPTNPALQRYTPELAEVSLVDNPCVPTATFEYIKADGSKELRKFNHKETEMAEEIDDKGEATRPQDKGGVTQGFMAKDGTFHIKKAAAIARNEEVDAQGIARPALDVLQKIDDAVAKSKASDRKKEEDDEDDEKEGDDEETKAAKKARKAKKAEEAEKAKKDADDEAKKAADDELGKKDYSDEDREKMADAGQAMEDGSFPIKTKKDLENAIQAYGRAKDKPKAKAHIEARAKALDAEDLLPKDWDGEGDKKGKKGKSGKSAGGDLEKGMYGVARLADLLQTLDYLQQCSGREEAAEGDDSTVPAKLKAALSSLGDILKQMTAEEVDELLDGDDGEDSTFPVMFMSAKSGELGKRGAAISAASKDHIDKMMKSAADHMDEMGKCYKALGMADDDEDDDKGDARKMSQVAGERDALQKVLGDMTPKLESVYRTVEALAAEKEQLTKRIEHLEGQPMPAKGAVRAVDKGGDNGGHVSDGDVVRKFNEYMDALAPEEKSRQLMKFALANPVKVTA